MGKIKSIAISQARPKLTQLVEIDILKSDLAGEPSIPIEEYLKERTSMGM